MICRRVWTILRGEDTLNTTTRSLILWGGLGVRLGGPSTASTKEAANAAGHFDPTSCSQMADNLNIVGDRLAKIADTESDPVHFDLFSRSAFNRYYYSAFLTVRTALRNIGCEPKKPTHKNVRDALTGEVRKRLKRELRKGQLTAAEASRIRYVATTVVADLELLLHSAYDVRCVADYRPEQRVDGTGSPGGAKLADCTISLASGWRRRAELHTGAIQNAYDRLGLI